MTLTELETLARTTTPEWVARQRFPGSAGCEYTIETPTGDVLFCSTSYGNMLNYAKYIHSASPATVLALIERCRTMERGLQWYADDEDYRDVHGNSFARTILSLRGEAVPL